MLWDFLMTFLTLLILVEIGKKRVSLTCRRSKHAKPIEGTSNRNEFNVEINFQTKKRR